MKVRVKRIDCSLPLPAYATTGSVAVDLCAREETLIPPRALARIPMNVIIEVPNGYMLVVVPRSSVPQKKGISIPHGIGVIDQDFCGPKDEVNLLVFNFTDAPVTVEKGERIGQAVFVKIEKPEVVEVETAPSQKNRGGFGGTG